MRTKVPTHDKMIKNVGTISEQKKLTEETERNK